jgi:hypothetical protein
MSDGAIASEPADRRASRADVTEKSAAHSIRHDDEAAQQYWSYFYPCAYAVGVFVGFVFRVSRATII